VQEIEKSTKTSRQSGDSSHHHDPLRRRNGPINNVTGRDAFIVAQALAYAAEAIDRLPLERRQQSHRADMLRLLHHIAPDDAANYFRAEAYRVIGGIDMSGQADRRPRLRSLRFEE
jgi:hypothetical protein